MSDKRLREQQPIQTYHPLVEPKTMFTELGETRLTGSMTVYFHAAHQQKTNLVSEQLPQFEHMIHLDRFQNRKDRARSAQQGYSGLHSQRIFVLER